MNSARRLVMAIGIALVIASACAFQNPVSPDYPCGTQGLECGSVYLAMVYAHWPIGDGKNDIIKKLWFKISFSK